MMLPVCIEPATAADLPLIMQFITQAQQHLKDQGIDQWQDGYPNADSITADIARKTGYIAQYHGETFGYFSIDFAGEPAYATIKNGAWNTKEPYAVVHRFTIGDAFKGKGLANLLFTAIDAHCKAAGIAYFRIDTADKNNKMQHILTKHGFAYCGEVFYGESLRLAFDKTIV